MLTKLPSVVAEYDDQGCVGKAERVELGKDRADVEVLVRDGRVVCAAVEPRARLVARAVEGRRLCF